VWGWLGAEGWLGGAWGWRWSGCVCAKPRNEAMHPEEWRAVWGRLGAEGWFGGAWGWRWLSCVCAKPRNEAMHPEEWRAGGAGWARKVGWGGGP